MKKPRVLNKSVDGTPAGSVYVGRPSKWGNPFSHLGNTEHTVTTREESIIRYREWLLQQPKLMTQLPKLRGRDLVCWCAPKHCHAQVLIELANEGITKPARPFLKWAGGKTRLLPEILPRLPESCDTYCEPFLGGGAVFFALAEEEYFKHAVLSDSNQELVDTWKTVQRNVDGVIRALERHRYEKEYYYKVRKQNPQHLPPAKRAARMIFLNRTGFNGLYRVNKSGKFNVPFGRYKNPTICDEENLHTVAATLDPQRVTIQCCSFEKAVAQAIHSDWGRTVFYFDPPYLPRSKTSSFTAYGANGFDLQDHGRLHDKFAELERHDIYALLSNSDVPEIHRLFARWSAEVVRSGRPINSDGGKRGDVSELLINNEVTWA